MPNVLLGPNENADLAADVPFCVAVVPFGKADAAAFCVVDEGTANGLDAGAAVLLVFCGALEGTPNKGLGALLDAALPNAKLNFGGSVVALDDTGFVEDVELAAGAANESVGCAGLFCSAAGVGAGADVGSVGLTWKLNFKGATDDAEPAADAAAGAEVGADTGTADDGAKNEDAGVEAAAGGAAVG